MRVLFTTQPGHGHLNSMVPYAAALRDAGHEVRFATAPSFGPAVERLGFPVCPAGADFIWERAAGAHLREQAQSGGEIAPRRVVSVSSISGLYGAAAEVSYSAAKAALIALTRSLANEWGRYGVRVNCVAYGLIETRLTRATEAPVSIDIRGPEMKVGIDSGTRARIGALTPLGRAGTVQEAAGALPAVHPRGRLHHRRGARLQRRAADLRRRRWKYAASSARLGAELSCGRGALVFLGSLPAPRSPCE